jgi:hypothetical protein
MPHMTQLVLTLQSRPGVLAKIARTLADASVNIVALCAGEGAGRGKLRLLVNNPVKARQALRAAGYRAAEEPAFLIRMRNRPGTLARVAERVARARINIKLAYATTAGSAAAVVMTVSSPSRARRVLR